MTLQRLVLDYRSGEVVVRCLYRSRDGAGPSTKRTREVTELVRTGLTRALEALEGGAECVGTNGLAAVEAGGVTRLMYRKNTR